MGSAALGLTSRFLDRMGAGCSQVCHFIASPGSLNARGMALARTFSAAGRSVVVSPGAGSALIVVTYNILANKYAVSGYHDYCPDALLEWSHRGPADHP